MARSNPLGKRSRRRSGPRSSPFLSPSASSHQRRGVSARRVKRSPPVQSSNGSVSNVISPSNPSSSIQGKSRNVRSNLPVSGHSVQPRSGQMPSSPSRQQKPRPQFLSDNQSSDSRPSRNGRTYQKQLQSFPGQRELNQHELNQRNINSQVRSRRSQNSQLHSPSPFPGASSTYPKKNFRSQSSPGINLHSPTSGEMRPHPLKSNTNIRQSHSQKSQDGYPSTSTRSSSSSSTTNRPRSTDRDADPHQQLAFNSAFSHLSLNPLQRQQHGDLTRPSISRQSLSTPSSFVSSRTDNIRAIHLPSQQGRSQTLNPRPIVPREITHSESAFPGHGVNLSSSSLKRRSPKLLRSPLVYAMRLLILGTGLGVVAGTLISALGPSRLSGGNGAGDRSQATAEDVNTTAGAANSGLDPANALGASPIISNHTFSNGSLGLGAMPKGQAYTELVNQLEAMGAGQTGLLPGVFAIDLDTYNYVGLNESITFSAASTIKVPILIAFLQDVEQNKIRLDEVMTMTAEDVASGSGDMQWGTVGDTYTAVETATKMIVISDNTATNMLIRRMGGAEQLNQRFRSWGLSLTQIRNPLPDLEGTNTTSPTELTYLMAMVSEGKLLSMRSRDRMLDIMYRTQTATLLPAGIGENAAIAHKTGDIGLMVGDTGLVDSPNGKRYAITILMRRPHNDERAQELIRQMVGLIHEKIQSPPTTSSQEENSVDFSVDFSADGTSTGDATTDEEQ